MIGRTTTTTTALCGYKRRKITTKTTIVTTALHGLSRLGVVLVIAVCLVGFIVWDLQSYDDTSYYYHGVTAAEPPRTRITTTTTASASESAVDGEEGVLSGLDDDNEVRNHPSNHDDDDDDDDDDKNDADVDGITKFRSRHSNVYVIPNFLPHDLAVHWRDTMKQMWNEDQKTRFNKKKNNDKNEDVCSTNGGDSCAAKNDSTTALSSSSSSSSSWLYATNNNGLYDTQSILQTMNQKVRSLENITIRNETANKMKSNHLFSYAKWELHPQHALVKEMEHAFASTKLRTKVEHILNQQQQQQQNHDDTVKIALASQLSDLFVTLYSTGDFLSTHDDGVCGTWAFVLSLMAHDDDVDGDDSHNSSSSSSSSSKSSSSSSSLWNAEQYGGGLQFECPYSKEDEMTLMMKNTLTMTGSVNSPQWCQVLYPTFNSLVLFQTRVPTPSSFLSTSTAGIATTTMPLSSSSFISKFMPGPKHQVLPVSYQAEADGFYRFGLTGWYMDINDEMPDLYQKERDKMRAR